MVVIQTNVVLVMICILQHLIDLSSRLVIMSLNMSLEIASSLTVKNECVEIWDIECTPVLARLMLSLLLFSNQIQNSKIQQIMRQSKRPLTEYGLDLKLIYTVYR